MLQREKLPIERLIRLHLGFCIKRPAFDVHAVESEHSARGGHAGFNDFRELKFVAGASLVSGERPRAGIVTEVVEMQRFPGGIRRLDTFTLTV